MTKRKLSREDGDDESADAKRSKQGQTEAIHHGHEHDATLAAPPPPPPPPPGVRGPSEAVTSMPGPAQLPSHLPHAARVPPYTPTGQYVDWNHAAYSLPFSEAQQQPQPQQQQQQQQQQVQQQDQAHQRQEQEKGAPRSNNGLASSTSTPAGRKASQSGVSWSGPMTHHLLHLLRGNEFLLVTGKTDNETNIRKRKGWARICEQLLKRFPQAKPWLTATQVREKFKKLKQTFTKHQQGYLENNRAYAQDRMRAGNGGGGGGGMRPWPFYDAMAGLLAGRSGTGASAVVASQPDGHVLVNADVQVMRWEDADAPVQPADTQAVHAALRRSRHGRSIYDAPPPVSALAPSHAVGTHASSSAMPANMASAAVPPPLATTAGVPAATTAGVSASSTLLPQTAAMIPGHPPHGGGGGSGGGGGGGTVDVGAAGVLNAALTHARADHNVDEDDMLQRLVKATEAAVAQQAAFHRDVLQQLNQQAEETRNMLRQLLQTMAPRAPEEEHLPAQPPTSTSTVTSTATDATADAAGETTST
ncbi:hypothetical protein PTSG_00646 [Salpingoeca rosetta]|uniref:Uncharacterized protein n=1 Tax=Salpingoeca rosetta (strain ATCC 50818 / BSB-021) TaxID=946362 RepID=F2TX30_SALR5|nr:uncharacterized protein PTSG_00646 [Salpingoeca rosetta]EGD75939.1 hypothetical protein PTSG_00646 [Salpingoeca rosetta]|eukprot:XP_004998115.1 hypothetical protein PTSG_00646 [Salpingoeca rosetta]